MAQDTPRDVRPPSLVRMPSQPSQLIRASGLQAAARVESEALQHDLARRQEMVDTLLGGMAEIERVLPAQSEASQIVARTMRHCAALMAMTEP